MVTSATLGGWVSSLPVAVSGPAQSGQAQAPVGTTYSFAKVTNSTPWIVTVLGSLGSQTIQPFTFDLIPVIPPNGIIFNYSLPPNGPATLQAGQPSYFQVDWWTGSATPPGSYPGQLTAQAVAAAIAAVVLTSTVQFTAASNVAIAVDTSQTLALDSFVYPTGLSAVNFHAAAVAITQTGSSSGGPISVYLVDENGAALWESTFVVPPGFSGPDSTTVPLPLTFGTLNGTCAIVIINDAADITVDVILDQEPNTPGVLIAGQQAGTTLQVEEPSTSSVSETLTLSPTGKLAVFGPAVPVNSLWVTLSVVIYSLVSTAVGSLEVQLQDTNTGDIVAALLIPLPTTANFPASLEAANITVPVNYPHVAEAGGVLTLNTIVKDATPTTLTGRVLAVVGYR